MSGRIGGRSNVAHMPLPVAVFPPVDVAQVGPGMCSCVAQSSTIPGGATLDAAPGLRATAAGSDFCAADHVVACTMDTWILTGAADIQTFQLMARCASQPSALDSGGYVFYIYTDGALGGTVTMGLAAFNQFTDIATPLTHQTAPVNGDTFSLSAVGTSIVAKKNGSTVLSATDSTITEGVSYAVVVGADNYQHTIVTGCTITTSC